MRITYITASAGNVHCGACTRDIHLVRGLSARGHDVTLVPLYTPLLRTDMNPPARTRVFFGGVSVYLQHLSAAFRHAPAAFDRLFDHPALLRLASRFALSTRPESLGPMTVSVLAGREGRQRREVGKLIAFLVDQPRPDVIGLTNSLLSGIVPALKEALGAPVLCGLQGEDAFVAGFAEPHRSRARELIQANARAVDLFFASHEAYADRMAEFLAVGRDRVRVIAPGIDADVFTPAGPRRGEPFTIGYLSRIAPDKGLDTLVEAFRILVVERGRDARLAAAGRIVDKRFWRKVLRLTAAAGLSARFDYAGEPGLAGKLDFLRGLSVFALPSRYEETRGMAALEALGAGLPAVLPDRGIYREFAATTGAVVLTAPDDPASLADALAALMADPARADRMGREAAQRVHELYNHALMAERTETLCRQLAAGRP